MPLGDQMGSKMRARDAKEVPVSPQVALTGAWLALASSAVLIILGAEKHGQRRPPEAAHRAGPQRRPTGHERRQASSPGAALPGRPPCQGDAHAPT